MLSPVMEEGRPTSASGMAIEHSSTQWSCLTLVCLDDLEIDRGAGKPDAAEALADILGVLWLR